MDFFFHLFSAPKFSPLLPTTYQPLPPSLHRQSSRNVERERAWSLSRSCWSRSLELPKLGIVPGVGAGPTRYRGKPSSFLFFCNAASLLQFFFVALQRSKPSYFFCFLLLCAAVQPTFFIFFVACVAALKRSQPSSFFFVALCCSVAA